MFQDEQFYVATITGVSHTTAVVHFDAYGNHEEVLLKDLLPVNKKNQGQPAAFRQWDLCVNWWKIPASSQLSYSNHQDQRDYQHQQPPVSFTETANDTFCNFYIPPVPSFTEKKAS